MDLRIEGKITLESLDSKEGAPQLAVYVFDRGGQTVGQADVDAQGNFSVSVNRPQPDDVELFIGPTGQSPKDVRESSAYSRLFTSKEWTGDPAKARIKADLTVSAQIWRPWRPARICVSGRIRKVHTVAGKTDACPVSFVKVEVYDVDREGCWWPYLLEVLPSIQNLSVLPIEKIINPPLTRPWPWPGPDPGPESISLASLGSRQNAVALNPQPLPPRAAASFSGLPNPGSMVAFDPQPDPPADISVFTTTSIGKRVGEVAGLSASAAASLENLTLTSRVSPWILRPLCFYSRALVCSTFTDCDGFYRCCFTWWPAHWRRGRLRFDLRPDIIIKVTQTIDGVETIIYLDPYTSTRWNVSNAVINLNLDDERIVCGAGCSPVLPGTSQASVLQIGSDPVFTINQADGMYTVPPISNAPYGGSINIYGNFSFDLKTGSPMRYYKLSYAPAGTSNFHPIQTTLSALRSTTIGQFHTHTLGPLPSPGPLAGLYEVRDVFHYWWLDTMGGPISGADLLAVWDTASIEPDQGAYTLRMEVFDETGAQIHTMQFPNHGGNGTGLDPAVPPVVVDHLDLKIAIDNRPMVYNLTTPATNSCGVIPWTPTLANTLTFHVHADQPHGRVDSWNLDFTRGINPTRNLLGSASFPGGVSPVDTDIFAGSPPNPIAPGLFSPALTTTCAFALILSAYIHVRGNWGFIWYGEKIYAIAIEKCVCPPPT